MEKSIQEAVRCVRQHVQRSPTIGIILGSGLGDFVNGLSDRSELSTKAIPYYPQSTVEGHKGKLIFAKAGDKDLLAFQGRIHFYESNNVESVLFPIHVAHQLGVRTLLITNAAGGVNRTFSAGDLMVISDQIDLTMTSFPQRTRFSRIERSPYDGRLFRRVLEIGQRNAIPLKSGVYVGLKGPSYETASEIEMIHRIGGDAVGMSTVLEASVAASLNLDVIGISCITNLATGITGQKLSHTEVTEVGNRVKERFGKLIGTIIGSL